jgi:3-oxoadipate enol-lactonase
MDQLGIETFIPVGYSMGGTIAQLMWKRHDHRVRGLVLAATAGHWATSRQERFMFTLATGISGLARVIPSSIQQSISERLYLSRKTLQWEPWAAQQIASHDWRNILEAGSALGRFDSRKWLSNVDVPTSVVITTEDQVVSPRRQRTLAGLIPNTHVFEISGNHDAAFARAAEFVPLLVDACLTVHRDALNRPGGLGTI